MTKYQTIWLNTSNATANADRTRFIFHNLPLIQIKKRSYIRFNSVSFIPAVSSLRNYLIKLVNIKFNRSCYYNTDGSAMPTLISYNQTTATNIQHGLYRLEIPQQDIINLEIDTADSAGRGLFEGAGTPGTVANLILCIVIEEAEEGE